MLIYLFAAFVVLNLIDAWSTTQILRFGGVELNPLGVWVFKKLGVQMGLIVSKAATIGVVWFALSGMPQWAMIAVDVIFVAVVINNLIVMRKMGHL